MPTPLLKHSYASPSVATDVMVKKYTDGLLLYRQEQQWKRQSVPLKRGTMANWMIRLSQRYFTRNRDRLQEEFVKQAMIHADETVLQVLKEEGRNPTSESRMWVYASSKRADKQIRLFDYRDSRKGECAKEFLKGFQDILITDGYVYNLQGTRGMFYTPHRYSLLRSNLIVVKGDFRIMTAIRQIMTKYRRTLDVYQ